MKTARPQLDELETGPPSFVTEIKKAADKSAMSADLLRRARAVLRRQGGPLETRRYRGRQGGTAAASSGATDLPEVPERR